MHFETVFAAAFFGSVAAGYIAIGLTALLLGLSLSMFCFLIKRTRDYEKEKRERDS